MFTGTCWVHSVGSSFLCGLTLVLCCLEPIGPPCVSLCQVLALAHPALFSLCLGLIVPLRTLDYYEQVPIIVRPPRKPQK